MSVCYPLSNKEHKHTHTHTHICEVSGYHISVAGCYRLLESRAGADCSALNIKVFWSIQTSVTLYLSARHIIPEHLNCQHLTTLKHLSIILSICAINIAKFIFVDVIRILILSLFLNY